MFCLVRSMYVVCSMYVEQYAIIFNHLCVFQIWVAVVAAIALVVVFAVDVVGVGAALLNSP